MFRFIKRQLKTKTGKLATGIILGSVTAAVTGEATIGQAASAGAVSLLAMFLRDKEAKKEQDNGE